jgi:hypothetical protein
MNTSTRTRRTGPLLRVVCLLFLSPLPAVDAAGTETPPAADRVTLSDGATIELLGVSEIPIRPESWWRADGSPLAKPPIGNVTCPPMPFEDRLKRVFVINYRTVGQAEIDGPNRFNAPIDQQEPPVTWLGSGETRSSDSSNLLYAFAAIRQAARIDLAMDYDSGPWRTVATSDGHDGVSADRAGKPQLLWERADGRVPEVWIAHNIDLDPEHLWLIAVDKNNDLHQVGAGSNSESGHIRVQMARFPDAAINRVKEYRLVTHLTDRRFRFKPETSVPASVATDVVWGPCTEEAGAAKISAACRIAMKSGRIVAIDDRGNEWPSKFGGSSMDGHFCEMSAVFPRLPLARVKEFRFQTRSARHHIEFRNVSLFRGQKNPAQIWLDGKRFVPIAKTRDKTR